MIFIARKLRLVAAGAVIARTSTALSERVGDLIITMIESSGADADMREMVEWGYRQSHADARRSRTCSRNTTPYKLG